MARLQTKRLETQVETTAEEQIALAEKQRETAASLRRAQASLEQLDVHRGAVRTRGIYTLTSSVSAHVPGTAHFFIRTKERSSRINAMLESTSLLFSSTAVV